MKIVTAAEMREIDRITSERFGVRSQTLMENAGARVAEFVLKEYLAAQTIGVICGKGNNGGDGLVAARKLAEAGKQVRLLMLADPGDLRGDAAEMFHKLQLTPIIARSREEFLSPKARAVFEAEVLVDAILGTGFHPPVTGLYAEAIEEINARTAPSIAIDIPSGADADVMGAQSGARARANAIVTFTAPRPAHVFGLLSDGPTVVFPIGSPDEAFSSSLKLNVITASDLALLIAARQAEVNKGNFGHVLVIGGSVGKSGAAAMAGMAALRAGAGLSTVATPSSVLPIVAGYHPELMTESLEETEAGTISLRSLDYDRFARLLQGKTTLAIGPGISRHPETAQFVRNLVAQSQLPLVLDADGLNAFEGQVEKLKGRHHPTVITPHPGEMARLVGSTGREVQLDRIGITRKFAQQHQVIVVLKGHRSLVGEPGGEVWVNTTGNPGMATGGTGDILTGMVAGFIAQHPEHILEAVLGAVHLHGLAGDIACGSMGQPSLVATDLLPALAEAFRRTRTDAQLRWARVA